MVVDFVSSHCQHAVGDNDVIYNDRRRFLSAKDGEDDLTVTCCFFSPDVEERLNGTSTVHDDGVFGRPPRRLRIRVAV